MEEKVVELRITEEDGNLYQFVKRCASIDYAKQHLKDAAELYDFCNADGGIQEGHLVPEIYRDRVLARKNKEELLQLKDDLEKKILLIVSDFHPDECDCGVMRVPDDIYWFIDEDSRLGFVTLYTNYINMIDEMLKRITHEE